MFTKTETFTAAVQFWEGKPSICGDTIKWLEEVNVVWKDYPFVGRKNYDKALTAACKAINAGYPEYQNQVALY